MKPLSILLLLVSLVGCTAGKSDRIDAGLKEAARLRARHDLWLAERPRKVDLMKVSGSDLSEEARGAGFFSASVTAGYVMLALSESEGFIFGCLSESEIQGFRELGLVVEPTVKSQVYRFRALKDGKPDRAMQRTPRSGAGVRRKT